MNEQRRARLRVLREHASDIVVPAAVLAESVLNGRVSHDYHVRRLLTMVQIAEVDSGLGYAAGALRREAMRAGINPPPSGVDALVMAVADDAAAEDDVRILTSDGEDLELLASVADHPARLTIVVV